MNPKSTDCEADALTTTPPRRCREAANNNTHYDVQSNVVPDVLKFHDVGYLEFDEVTKLPKVPQSFRDELITLGPILFQHTDNLPSLYGERSITSAWFKRRLANGEEVNRSWLLYSPINKAAYCFCCLLFKSSPSNSRASFESKNGFNKWRKPEKLKFHETILVIAGLLLHGRKQKDD